MELAFWTRSPRFQRTYISSSLFFKKFCLSTKNWKCLFCEGIFCSTCFQKGTPWVQVVHYCRNSGGGKQTLEISSKGNSVLPCTFPSRRLMWKPLPHLVSRTTRYSCLFKTIGWKSSSDTWAPPRKRSLVQKSHQAVILKGCLLFAKEHRVLSFTFCTFSFCFYSLGLYKETFYATDYLKLFFYPNKMLLWLQLPNPVLFPPFQYFRYFFQVWKEKPNFYLSSHVSNWFYG